MDQAVLVTRMFSDACHLNPPSKLLCSETQSKRGDGGKSNNREMGRAFNGTGYSEIRTVASPHLILSGHPIRDPDLLVHPHEANP